MKRKTNLFIYFIVTILLSSFLIGNINTCEAKTRHPVYTISPKSKPCDQSRKYGSYNKKTRQYYLVLSYLKKLESKGGGTLILKKGTYSITNNLYVPSNVTIILKNGVKIKKGKHSGVRYMPAAKAIFVLCSDKKKYKKGAYRKYNGVKNVSIIGKGNATIDLDYMKDSIGIMMGHNKNITIQGITFKNMYSGHFIELDASKEVKITKCTFKNHKNSENNLKEAINIDTPDRATEGFHAIWTSYDKTPNNGVAITYCRFLHLERAVGTHKYSGGKYHQHIEIKNNEIKGCDKDAIRVMNWKHFTIKNNIINGVGNGRYGVRAILVSGASDMAITGNTFKNVSRPIQLMPWKNSGPGKKYKVTYNKVTTRECQLMEKNSLYYADEYFVRINYKYNVFSKYTEEWPLV